MANLLRMGHCAPTVMRTILDVDHAEKHWLVRLAGGLPGGIGNTGGECGGVTAPLVLLGLRYGLGSPHEGLPILFDKGHHLCRQFSDSHRTLLCRGIRGDRRLPIPCIGVVRRSPELYADVAACDQPAALTDEQRTSYASLYRHLVDNEFHCAHAVFQRLRPRKIVDQELLDATAGFIGGTLFTGMTCSAFTAGVMAVGVMIGEIENSRLRVLHMIAKMAAGGDAFDDDINKFNRVMNIGNRMARWFTDVFGSTQCRAITQCDFSTKSGVAKYIEVECVARCKTIAATVAETVEKVGKEGTAREGRDVDQGQGLSVR